MFPEPRDDGYDFGFDLESKIMAHTRAASFYAPPAKLSWRLLWVVGFAFLAGCNSEDETSPPPQPVPPSISFQPCPDGPALQCGTLQVPLDHAHPDDRSLTLEVRRNNNPQAPRGVLVFLAGGPGQNSQQFLASLLDRFPPSLARAYQWVTIDTRGTGQGALNCPALQQEAGTSDLRPATPAAIAACAEQLGEERRFFSTADTVADLELLRQALQVEKLTLNGISYGTYVASTYAVTYPQNVARLVLDSPVPHNGLDMLMRHVLQAVPANLRQACLNKDCEDDPVAALASLIQQGHDSVQLLDTLVLASITDPGSTYLPIALVRAAQGEDAALQSWFEFAEEMSVEPNIALFSSGLHITTFCQDMIAPWGNSATALNQRQARLDQRTQAVPPGDIWPFDHRVMSAQGALANCLHWPATAPGYQDRNGSLPDVPALILSGAWDLSTPPAEAQRQLELAPGGRLVILPEASHSVQSSLAGTLQSSNFLCAEPYPYPVPETAEFSRC